MGEANGLQQGGELKFSESSIELRRDGPGMQFPAIARIETVPQSIFAHGRDAHGRGGIEREDDSSGPGDANHFAKHLNWVLDKVNDCCRAAGVERAGRKWKQVRWRFLKIDSHAFADGPTARQSKQAGAAIHGSNLIILFCE